jgi:molecular chaperone DnaK (HSP70)
MAGLVSPFEPIFGVDFGTSKVCAAAVDHGGVPTTLADPMGRKIVPAVLSLHEDGSVLVGEDALPLRFEDPKNTVYGVARLLGRSATSREVLDLAARSPFVVRVGPDDQPVISTRAGDLTAVDVAAFLLEHVRRNAALAQQTDSRRAVVTVPACATPAERQALTQAARQAGLAVERVLDAPLAFATAWSYGRAVPGGVVLVYDFGGGKLECTVVELRGSREPQILGTAADSLVSGDELVGRIVDFTVKAFWQVHRVDLRGDAVTPIRLYDAAERALRELSTSTETAIFIPEVARVPSLGHAVDLNLMLSRETLAAAVADIVKRSMGVCDEALRQAGLSVGGAGEILLAGGPTRLPFVRDQVAQYFGRPGRSDVSPDEGAAIGAAIWGVHGGVADSVNPASISKRVTAQFGSDAQQSVPAPAVANQPGPARMGRVHTKRMFTAIMSALTPPAGAPGAPVPVTIDPGRGAGVSFSEPRMVKPVMLEVLASRLAVSTVGGFCDEIIARDTAVPTEKTRTFSTGKDGQRMVKVSVCQGDSRRFAENLDLGTIVLDGLPARPRGGVKIGVTFSVDGDGVLRASARDEETGRAQSVQIQLKGRD